MKTSVMIGAVSMMACAQAATLYVNPTADAATADGSGAKPYASLQQARDAVRQLRAKNELRIDERLDILLYPGDYVLKEAFSLSKEDSGLSEGASVVWRAMIPGTARITRATFVPVNLFKPRNDGGRGFVADISALYPSKIAPMATHFGGEPTAPFLFVNHEYMTLARYPNKDAANEGWATFTKCVAKGNIVKKRPDGGRVCEPGAFVWDDERAKKWDLKRGVWLNGYWTHDWDNHSVIMASFGTENGTNNVVRLGAQIPYGVMGGTWGRKERRFYAFNVLEELDAPGEWYLDREKKLLYIMPPNGSLSDKDEIALAFGGGKDPAVMNIAGVQHVRFEDIVVEYNYGVGVTVHSGSANVRFTGCRIGNCSSGIYLGGDYCVLANSEVWNMARTGVSVSCGDRRTLRKGYSRIEGNNIHHFGVFQRTYAPGINVGGCGAIIRKNLIHDAPHAAVLYGGNEMLFEYNNVYHVLNETGDAGAFYTGRDWTTQGNILRYNFVHDLGKVGDIGHTMGFYFDDCDCGDEVYGNVFWRCARGIMVGGGRDHPIKNNIFAECTIGMSIDGRGITWKHWNDPVHGGPSWMLEDKAKKMNYTEEPWKSAYPRLANIMNDCPREPLYDDTENNIFLNCKNQLIALSGKELDNVIPKLSFKGNVQLVSDAACTAKPDKRIAEFFTINTATNNLAAFGFEDAARGNFRLRPDALVRKLCPAFKDLPLDEIPAAK